MEKKLGRKKGSGKFNHVPCSTMRVPKAIIEAVRKYRDEYWDKNK